MIVKECEPKNIKNVLQEFLAQKNIPTVFVFPTNVALESWTDWISLYPQESGVQAVEMENFTAWDRFKSAFLKEKITDKKAIPALLRKLFVRNLIYRNNTQQPVFKKIIQQDKDNSVLSYAFTDWIAKMLPSLEFWHKKYTEYAQSKNDFFVDEEDSDYLFLYEEYKNYLSSNSFFEPSWETPHFTANDKRFVIFFPELLEDFADYKSIFENAENVVLVQLPENLNKETKAYCFSDSRKELRRLILHIRDLHETKKIPWTDIAFNVPDMQTYTPYIRREFEKYCVPYSLRAGTALTQNSAGSIFTNINDCYSQKFSYSSVRSLLQNEYVPWKESLKPLKDELIKLGCEKRCVCSYLDKDKNKDIDSWEESLTAQEDCRVRDKVYKELKKDITSLCQANSFAAIRTGWMIFKNKYFEEESFSPIADKILGRCLSELSELIEIENEYILPHSISVGPHYNFFLSELNAKIYKEQEDVCGVSVFPYKLAAVSNFPYQFVIDASQQNIDVSYKKLSFLSTQKRQKLLQTKSSSEPLETFVSNQFIQLYAKDSESNGEVVFSFAEDTFAGFAIGHTFLCSQQKKDTAYQELDKKDFIQNESKSMLTINDKKDLSQNYFTKQMKDSFFSWKQKTINFCSDKEEQTNPYVKEMIVNHLQTKDKKGFKVSQTDMKNFFVCPRNWILNQVLKVKEDSLDTSIIQKFDIGNVHHKILEIFLKKYMAKDKPLPITDGTTGLFSEDVELEVRKLVLDATDVAIIKSSISVANSILAQTSLQSQKELIVQTIMNFLHAFCKAPDKPAKLSSRTKISGFGGFYVKGSEKEITIPFDDKKDLFYTGKIDCLLYEKASSSDDGSSQYAIIDFKNSSIPTTNSSSRTNDEGKLEDFQMPMYVTLVLKEELLQNDLIEAAYFYSIKNAGNSSYAIDNFKGKAANAEGADLPYCQAEYERKILPIFKDYTNEFFLRIENSDFKPSSKSNTSSLIDVQPHRDCVGCSYKTICRTTFTVGSKSL